MGRRSPFSLSTYFTLGIYAFAYLTLAGQSSCSGTGTKTFGNVPGSSSSLTGASSQAVAAASFDGLISASTLSATAASLEYGNSVGLASINVYCKIGALSTSSVLVRNFSALVSTGGSVTLNNLSSGTTYTCHGLAVNAAGVESVNLAPPTVTFKTNSVLATAYRNVILVKAFGDTVNPTAQPTNRMVDITWKAFSDASITGTTTYSVYRTMKGTYPTFSSSTVPACTSSTTTGTCKVSCQTGSVLGGTTTLRCIDTSVAVSPAQYWYYLSPLTQTTVASGPPVSLPEEYPSLPGQLPSDPLYPKVSSTVVPTADTYLTTVPIPPSEMVLVHRESVNYEFCNLINATSDLDTFASANGRGHLFKNRCAYDGLGARPINSNPSGISISIPGVAQNIKTYDFGYNLFIDRYEAGCNWTTQAGGGMCGPGGTPGDCVGTLSSQGNAYHNTTAQQPYRLYGTRGAPSNTLGMDGNVYLAFANGMFNANGQQYDGPSCWVKVNGTWQNADAATTNPNAPYGNLFTNAPKNQITAGGSAEIRPPLLASQSSSATICQAQSATSLGYPGIKKRLLRRREFVAASAWEVLQGEPNRRIFSQIDKLRNSTGPVDANFVRAGCYQPYYVIPDGTIPSIAQAPNWAGYIPGASPSYQGANPGPFPIPASAINATAGAGFFLASLWPSGISMASGVLPAPTSLSQYSPNNGFFTAWANPAGFGATGLGAGWQGWSLTPSGPGFLAVGSPWTQNCVSRFGAQDLLGNVGEWNSDEMTCDTTNGCVATSSRFDDGALGLSSGYGLDGNLGPMAKDPLWFVMSAGGGSNNPDAFNQTGNGAWSNISVIYPRPASRNSADVLVPGSMSAGNGYLKSQFQVFSAGPTPLPVWSPNATVNNTHVRYFHPAVGLPANTASPPLGVVDMQDSSMSIHALGLKSFFVMNGASRVGMVSGAPVSSGKPWINTGDYLVQGGIWLSSWYNGTTANGALLDGLSSHATRWAPVWEHEDRITGTMHIPQPGKGFRCGFSPDL